jgi:hypothetical protein
MALPFYNVTVTLYRTDFDTQSQAVIFSVKGVMYPADPAQNLVLPLGPDPTILTFYDIVIGSIEENPGLVLPIPGDELIVVPLSTSAFGLNGTWRVRADPMAYNGGQDFNELNSVVMKVTRVVA